MPLISRLVGEWLQRALAIVVRLSVQLSFFDSVSEVSAVSNGQAFASEAGFGRSLYTTYARVLKREYLLQMSGIKRIPRRNTWSHVSWR
jgi:hypothetical protein